MIIMLISISYIDIGDYKKNFRLLDIPPLPRFGSFLYPQNMCEIPKKVAWQSPKKILIIQNKVTDNPQKMLDICLADLWSSVQPNVRHVFEDRNFFVYLYEPFFGLSCIFFRDFKAIFFVAIAFFLF